MIYERTPPAQRFSQAAPSPVLLMKCLKCGRQHDGLGSRKWLGTLRMCRFCVAERDARRAGRVA